MREMVQKIGDDLPQFNDYLLRQFRKQKIDEMVTYLDLHFRNVVKPLFQEVEYVGYKILSPVEEAQWRIYYSPEKGKININFTSCRVVKYTLKLDDTYHHMFIQLPYMDPANKCIYYNNNEYYPLLVISERLIRAGDDEVTIKLAQAALKFVRGPKQTIKSTDGQAFTEYVIGTVLHTNTKNKEHKAPPLVLYHLLQYGFIGTLEKYGFRPEDIEITDYEKPDDEHMFFGLPGNKFVKVKKHILKGNDRITTKNNIRFLIGIIRSFKTTSKYSVEDVYRSGTQLFFMMMGHFISNINREDHRIIKYAKDHYNSYSVMLDPTMRNHFQQAGYPCEDMGDLLLHVFSNLDTWLIDQPNNLFGKMFSLLELTISNLIEKISREMYSVINSKNKGGINQSKIATFVKKVSNHNAYWFANVCRVGTTVIHNNWLMTIGLRYERQFKSQTAGKPPAEMQVSHYSWISTKSLLCLPSQKPIVTGTINPYVPIDQDGVIHPHSFSGEISDIFD